MNIEITARHFELTGAIREYAQRRIETLDHLDHRILGAHLVVDHDDHHSAEQYLVKAHLTVPGNTVNAEVRAAGVYEAIDLVAEKLAGQLRKMHDRRASRAAATVAE